MPIRTSRARFPPALLLRVVYRSSLVVPTMRASPMRLLHLVAVRTFGQSRSKQTIVRASGAGAPLGMSSFWIWHNTTPCFAPRSWLHTTPGRSRSDSMGFPPQNLLFLEPVLLQSREGSQSRIRRVRLTPALFMIQVGPATRAQPPAVALAYYFHRQ